MFYRYENIGKKTGRVFRRQKVVNSIQFKDEQNTKWISNKNINVKT